MSKTTIKKSFSLKDDPIRIGVKNKFRKDIYYTFIESSWRKLIFTIFFFYILSNLVFGFIYFIIPGSINNQDHLSFYDAFSFSVQTMSTIGYGSLSPTGLISNIVVTLEAAFGIISVAIMTGLIFSKISKPHAKIFFSNKMIYSKINGLYHLTFRIGNIRGNDIVEAKVALSALIDESTVEGNEQRKVYDLKLQREYTPFFKLSWSIFHLVDESSPLFNILNRNDADNKLRGLAVTVSGHDGTFSSTVYARYIYDLEDIHKDKYFEDILEDLPDGRVKINYDKFNDLKN